MKFKVEDKVFEKLGDVCFGVVIARGVDNKSKKSDIDAMLNSNVNKTQELLNGVNIKEYPSIAIYRDAFVKLGFNPNKFSCSIEALIKRILKGGDFPKINNVVDLGNAISIKHILPLGAHDMDRMDSDLEVRFSRPDDVFLPFGSTEIEAVDADELVYASGSKVKTRRWIWRQSDEGKITEESTNIFFPIDGFAESNFEAMIAARDELANTLKEIFNCEIKVGLVDKNSREIEL